MISLYSPFRGASQTCLCKGTSVQAGQLSKSAHLSGCPNSHTAIRHLPPKLQMTRKFKRENSSYLTATRAQFSTATANISNAFFPSPLLRLTDGKRHKTRKNPGSDADTGEGLLLPTEPRIQTLLPPSETPPHFFTTAWKKKGVDLPVFHCNSHLIGRGLEIFVAQDILCGTEGVTSFSSSRGRGDTFISPLGPGAFPPCTSLTLPVRGQACFAKHQLCSSEI